MHCVRCERIERDYLAKSGHGNARVRDMHRPRCENCLKRTGILMAMA